MLFVLAVTYAAVLVRPFTSDLWVNVVVGALLGLVIIGVEARLREAEVTDLLGALIGGAIGLGLAKTIGAALFWADASDPRVAFLHSFILLVFPYLGIVMGARKGEWLEPARLVGLFRDAGPQKRYRLLDTSVIIDGRIADVCETGFLDGTLVIPQFVLKELQLVADSPDSLKRNRGRRGLDILQKVQKMSGLDVMISDIDFPEVREVDLKLIELARTLQGKIVTNDFNLNKVAQLRGVQVLNINELANALKPVVLPGEFMKVFILKEGKEYNQGVAYLDDGTMVVVDNARRMISKNIDIVVTSVLQTTAGKMIFGRYIEGPGAQAVARTGRHSRGGAGARRRLAKPARRDGPSRTRSDPAVSLVADGLLPDSRHRRLHDRARHDLDPVVARRFERRLRPPLRARLGLADPADDRRARDGARRSSGLEPHRSYVFAVESSEHLRHPDRVRVAAVAAAHRREGLARAAFRSSAGTCRRTGHLLVDRKNPGAGIVKKMARLVGGARSLIVFPEGTRSVDGAVGALQGRDVPRRDRRRPAGRAGQHRRQPPRDAEGAADDLPRRRDADHSRADSDRRGRREGARELAERVRAVVQRGRR